MHIKRKSVKRRSRLQQQATAALWSFLVTLVAFPASAGIDLPTDPLTTGARVPPNILFILDDSGSMSFTTMYNEDVSGVSPSTTPSIRSNSKATNTIYYDPAESYLPWVGASGELMTGGVTYGAAYADFDRASGSTINLASASSCSSHMANGSNTSVCGGLQTFYVPKTATRTAAYLSDGSNYYRYQIHTDGRIVRSELRQGGTNAEGVTGRNCSSANGGSTWRWKLCQYTTPTGRTEAAERNNFATWFSYHRTRMKAAKAGASVAFNDLQGDIRVGFRTIWGRNGANTNANWPTQSVPIPVAYNDGLFRDEVLSGVGLVDNRTKWYSRLHNTTNSGTTPLHGALTQAGDYFSSAAENGPYGPLAAGSQLACRQNFAILTTDGYWNAFNNHTNRGNADNAAGEPIEGPGGQSYSYAPGAPYSDDWGGSQGTLADVAMHYWKTDLRPDLPNVVPSSTARNPAFWQHMVTFGLSIGLKGQTGFASVESVPAGFTGWPNPMSAENSTRIDDLLHAALNSRGTFVAAASPEEFRDGLRGALATIAERTGSFSNVAANSTSLDTDTRVFQASYVSGLWAGNLTASAITDGSVAAAPSWTAVIPTSGRSVFTANGEFPASATPTQLTALTRIGGASNFPVAGDDNAAYLAGGRTLEMSEGGHLRNRTRLLGDIVGSSPAYVDANGAKTLYVGANDGMLHAFDAEDGEELFAFIPSGINWTDLGSLSRPDYAHRYFVDGPVVVSSAQQTTGRNVLAATLGKGGKGVFALDVTSPSGFDHTKVLWENYETPGENMGLIQGAPIIARLPNGTGGTFAALIAGNGINSTNERAVLLVYDLVTGELVKEISTESGSEATPNGLSAPVGWDPNGDGVVDHVYAGDMLGNVWKFDLTGSTSSWGVANDGDPLFVATDDAGNRQSITGRLTVAMHPANFSTWVFFGTGRFMTVGDMEDKQEQSLYAIRDSGESASRSALVKRETTVVGTSGGRAVRAFQASGALPLEVELPGGDKTATRGWYINLLEPPAQSAIGERIVSEAQVLNRVLVVASIIPTADACQSDGRGYINALDAFTGTSLSSGSFFDVDGDGDFADEVIGPDGAKLPIGSVDLGVGMPTLPNLLRELAVAGGSTGGTGSVGTKDARYTGRVSWREQVGN